MILEPNTDWTKPWPGINPDNFPYDRIVTTKDTVTIPEKVITDFLENKKLKEATKHDTGKTDWSLMPFDAIEEINKVLDFGAKKYSAHNWKQAGGFKYTRVLNSLLRHIFAYMRGEDNDPESGLSHLAHAGCNIVFLLHYTKNKNKYNNDDRVV